VIRQPMAPKRACSPAKREMSSDQVHVQVGRRAMRLESENWNACYAMSNIMAGAVRFHPSGRRHRQAAAATRRSWT
jgi:hypothetical protein